MRILYLIDGVSVPKRRWERAQDGLVGESARFWIEEIRPKPVYVKKKR